MSWQEARARFPVLERYAYLNAGSVGPLARATAEAIAREERRDLVEGRGAAARFEAVLAMREQTRAAFAALLGVDADCIALADSTTEACRIVFAGLQLQPSDEVVTTDCEHFGLLGALHASGTRVRVARVRDRPAASAIDAILAEVGPRTRLLALSHVAWSTGHVLPVGELAESCEVPLLVDGAQSVGAIAVGAAAFDFYTVSGQKWLCGPDATGALYVRDPGALRVALPSYLSQDAYEPDGSFTPKAGARRFDPGWIGGPVLAGILTALEGAPEGRLERALEIASYCRERLAERWELVTEPGHATLVTWRARGDAKEAVRRAHEERVVIRDLPGLGWLRASCGWWTSEDDVERLVDALA